MKKFLLVCSCLLALLLVGGIWLFSAASANTLPTFQKEPLDALPGQMLQAMLTGEEVPVSPGQLNQALTLLPEEYRTHLLGVELTGENTGALWSSVQLLGRTCYVRAEVLLAFDPATTDLRLTLGEVRLGTLPLPEKLVEFALEEYLHGLDFSGKTIIINGNGITRAALQTDAAVIRNVRCDETALYLTPMSAMGLLGSLLGGNF